MTTSKMVSVLAGLLIVLVTVLATGSARADTGCAPTGSGVSQLEEQVKQLTAAAANDGLGGVHVCIKYDLSQVPTGFKCRTTEGCKDNLGCVYEKLSHSAFGESWKDPDGLIWSDIARGAFSNEGNPANDKNGEITDSEAAKLCADAKGRLPTKAEFEHGESQAFREVLPNMTNGGVGNWFASATVDPNDSRYTYFFGGRSGHMVRDKREGSVVRVRCVTSK